MNLSVKTIKEVVKSRFGLTMKANKGFQFQPVSQNDLEKVQELVKEGFTYEDAINLVNDINLSYEEDV